MGSILGLGSTPGGGNDNTFQYFCLGNLMERGAWRVTVHGVTKNQTQVSMHTHTHTHTQTIHKLINIHDGLAGW